MLELIIWLKFTELSQASVDVVQEIGCSEARFVFC
jgi:hypothetical protein